MGRVDIASFERIPLYVYTRADQLIRVIHLCVQDPDDNQDKLAAKGMRLSWWCCFGNWEDMNVSDHPRPLNVPTLPC